MFPSFLIDIFTMTVMSKILENIDLTNNTTIAYLRVLYICSVFSAYLIYYLVKKQVLKKNDKTTFKFRIPKRKSEDVVEKTTYVEYDIKKLDGEIKSLFKNAMIIITVHIQFHSNAFLFKQIPNPFIKALCNDIVRIHWFGEQIKRPSDTKGLWQFITRKQMPVLIEEDQSETAEEIISKKKN